jgi:predicted nucleotidyltransferase
VLAEEERKRNHLVVALSGAHAYGFPSPDSDLDLKAIHIAPTRALLGLSEPPTTHDRMEVLEGVEIDYTSNELGAVLRGLLKGNGNYLERVLGAHLLLVNPLLEELVPLARAPSASATTGTTSASRGSRRSRSTRRRSPPPRTCSTSCARL